MKASALVLGCALLVAAVLALPAARGQDGNGSIVGWGAQGIGPDFDADLLAVAAGL